MRDADYDCYEEWEYVRNTKEAIRARATLIGYTALISLPFIALTAAGTYFIGLRPHEVTGLSLYNGMVTALFLFDTLRNAAHDCFDEAVELRCVRYSKGIPVIDRSYPHHRIARLSFAIGGRPERNQA